MSDLIFPNTSTESVKKCHINIDFDKLFSQPSPQFFSGGSYVIAVGVKETLPLKDRQFDLSALKSNIRILNSFKDLPQNWNDNNAGPFNEELVDRAIRIVKNLDYQPKVFPTGRNSIQFEYEKPSGDYLEFEIFDNWIGMYHEVGGRGIESVINESQLIEIAREFHEL